MVFEKIVQPDSADDVARVVYSRRPAAEAARVNNSRHTCCCIYFSKTINPRISGVFDRPVALATIEPARRIDPIGVYYFFRLLRWLNRRYVTGKYLAYNRGL